MRNNQIRAVIAIIAINLLILAILFGNRSISKDQPKEDIVKCNEDSLRNEINNLQGLIEIQARNFDSEEIKREQIIFEYRYGLDRLKQVYPEAYREFHRIIGYKEVYTRETEIENKKRLQIYEHN